MIDPDEYMWVPVSQPLYVVRTGMERIHAGATGRTSSSEDDLHDAREAAESGLEHFCKPERVYALGVSRYERGDPTSSAHPMYLTGGYVLADWGTDADEVLKSGDDPVALEADARNWVTFHLDRAKRRIAMLPPPDDEPGA